MGDVKFGMWVRSLAIAAVVVMFAGCESVGGSLNISKKIDYKTESRAPALELPPDLTSPQYDDRYTVTFQLVASGEYKGKDKFQGESAEDTGMTAVYLGPQIGFTWHENLSAHVGADLPVMLENTSLQTVPDFRIRAGLTWRF